MPRLRQAWALRRLCLLFAFCGMSGAAFGGEYMLDWQRPGEYAKYRSCGCADRCWVAQVKARRSHRVIATLRCDCSTLYYALGTAPEQVHAPNCGAFDDEQKFERIPQELERLLRTGAAAGSAHDAQR